MQHFAIEVARERIRALHQGGLHPIALGGADLAEPPVLQHREHADQRGEGHGDDESDREPTASHEASLARRFTPIDAATRCDYRFYVLNNLFAAA